MVHEKTAKMYADAGMTVPVKTEDQVKANFERLTKGQKRKYRIDQMYRVSRIDRDYIVYNQTIISEDFPGNEITCSETVGYHEEPKFHKTYDTETGEPRSVSVSGTETVYDIPATKENILKILNGPDVIPTNTNFVLDHANVKYGGFTRDEFVNKHFDDLLFRVTNGYYPRQAKPFDGGGEGEVRQLKKDLVTTTTTTTESATAAATPEGGAEQQIIQEGEAPNQQEQEEEQEQEDEKTEEERDAEKEAREAQKERRKQAKEEEKAEREEEKESRRKSSSGTSNKKRA